MGLSILAYGLNFLSVHPIPLDIPNVEVTNLINQQGLVSSLFLPAKFKSFNIIDRLSNEGSRVYIKISQILNKEIAAKQKQLEIELLLKDNLDELVITNLSSESELQRDFKFKSILGKLADRLDQDLNDLKLKANKFKINKFIPLIPNNMIITVLLTKLIPYAIQSQNNYKIKQPITSLY